MTLMSPVAFSWTLTVLVGAGTVWALFDLQKLLRTRGADGSDPLVRDQRFGYIVGMVIGLIAFIGILRYHGVV